MSRSIVRCTVAVLCAYVAVTCHALQSAGEVGPRAAESPMRSVSRPESSAAEDTLRIVARRRREAGASSLDDTVNTFCSSATLGAATGHAHQLVPGTLDPGVADWEVTIPVPPVCTRVNSLTVQACDADEAPRVTLASLSSAALHRGGRLLRGDLHITLHCDHRDPTTATAAPTTTEATTTPLNKLKNMQHDKTRGKVPTRHKHVQYYEEMPPPEYVESDTRGDYYTSYELY